MLSVGSVDQRRGHRRHLVSSRGSGPGPEVLGLSHFDTLPGMGMPMRRVCLCVQIALSVTELQ